MNNISNNEYENSTERCNSMSEYRGSIVKYILKREDPNDTTHETKITERYVVRSLRKMDFKYTCWNKYKSQDLLLCM